MQFNAFIWNTFLESSRGREWLDFFSSLQSRYNNNDESLVQFILKWGSHGTLEDYQVNTKREIQDVLDAIKELSQAAKDGVIRGTIDNRKESEEFFREVGDLVTDDEKEDLFCVDDISRLSVALFCLYPKFFFPYYFYPNFYALEKIFNVFGIFLPPVPSKRDYDARFYYYLELCQSLYDYWMNLGLTPEHLPIFLYGFAPEVVELQSSSDLNYLNLPKPSRAWFVGGGTINGDIKYLDKVSDKSQTFWMGNKDTEAGDIIVMYVLAPRSEVHSIWRAARPGIVEPFRGYYSTVWITRPQLLKPLYLLEIKNDPILSQMPLVKGNMQGINGRQIQKKFYDRLLELLEKKGNKKEFLPSLDDKEIKDIELENERDVELNLLEPLLNELGFAPKDWERQISLQVGRSEKVIPDYLLHVTKDKHSKSVNADWVWEAKFSIKSNEQLQKDFNQVCSYANLVGAKGVGLISKEGIWVSSRSDGFSLKKARHWSAKQLHESDSLNQIRAIAGKKRILKG